MTLEVFWSRRALWLHRGEERTVSLISVQLKGPSWRAAPGRDVAPFPPSLPQAMHLVQLFSLAWCFVIYKAMSEKWGTWAGNKGTSGQRSHNPHSEILSLPEGFQESPQTAEETSGLIKSQVLMRLFLVTVWEDPGSWGGWGGGRHR